MWLNNGWYFILENITCGYGNHSWNIEFITRGFATRDKFNISLVITITTRDIFQYQIPAIVYSPIILFPLIFQLKNWQNYCKHLVVAIYKPSMRIILVLVFKHLSMKMMKTLQQCIIDTYVSTTLYGFSKILTYT